MRQTLGTKLVFTTPEARLIGPVLHAAARSACLFPKRTVRVSVSSRNEEPYMRDGTVYLPLCIVEMLYEKEPTKIGPVFVHGAACAVGTWLHELKHAIDMQNEVDLPVEEMEARAQKAEHLLTVEEKLSLVREHLRA